MKMTGCMFYKFIEWFQVAQVCAYALGIPLDFVSVKPSNNLISPNSTFTGNSMTSEAVCLVSQIIPK